MRKTLALIFCFAFGCAAAQTETTHKSGPLIDETEHTSSPAPTEPEAPIADAPPELPPDAIRREDLQTVLAAGPAALLQRVVTEPVRENGKFVGFRIAGFTGEPPGVIDLQPGDIILSVNGRKIERPENYFQVFEELQVASELRFELLRSGEVETLLYPIVD